MNKRWPIGIVSSIITLMLALPLVQANLGGSIRNIFTLVVEIGSLSFLGVPNGSLLLMFVRFLVGILVFTIFFALSTFLSGKDKDGKGRQLEFLKRNHAIVISGIIALITMVFLPVEVLLAAGGSLAILIAFLLIGGPLVAIILAILNIPPSGTHEDRGHIFIKLFLCCVLFWVLTAMNYHIGVVG
jgi:hypothetical protein